MPTYSNKGAKRYYYYLCYKETKRAAAECPVHQIPSEDVEMLVRLQLLRESGLFVFGNFHVPADLPDMIRHGEPAAVHRFGIPGGTGRRSKNLL